MNLILFDCEKNTIISYRLYSSQKPDFSPRKSRWEFLGMFYCKIYTFFESVEMILEFLREKTLVCS